MSERLGLIFPRFRYPSGDFPLGVATLASFVREQLGIDEATLGAVRAKPTAVRRRRCCFSASRFRPSG